MGSVKEKQKVTARWIKHARRVTRSLKCLYAFFFINGLIRPSFDLGSSSWLAVAFSTDASDDYVVFCPALNRERPALNHDRHAGNRDRPA